MVEDQTSGGGASAPSLSRETQGNIIGFSSLINRLPGNVVGRPLPGALAAMEVARIARAARAGGATLAWCDGQTLHPVREISAPLGEPALTLNDAVLTLRWAQFHRSSLAAFDHVLLREEETGRFSLLAAVGGPLLEPEGLRLLQRHFQRMNDGESTPGDWTEELEGLAALMRGGDPFAPRDGQNGESG
ncbi:MAG: hypothetical protein HQL51_06820 [Magnetococcales bacterium]|nr:hypothetical protein [Magnetococcales bacterium]